MTECHWIICWLEVRFVLFSYRLFICWYNKFIMLWTQGYKAFVKLTAEQKRWKCHWIYNLSTGVGEESHFMAMTKIDIAYCHMFFCAPFEVVPYTEEPFSHNWYTLQPPWFDKLIFNVAPIAYKNIHLGHIHDHYHHQNRFQANSIWLMFAILFFNYQFQSFLAEQKRFLQNKIF